MSKTKGALTIIDRMIGDDKELQEMIAQESINARVASMIYKARAKAALTQKHLAHLIGTTESVIAQLEHADYPGDSLAMLQRVASALNSRIEIRLVRAGGRAKTAARSQYHESGFAKSGRLG